jgi:RNA recognition motif-containing protein
MLYVSNLPLSATEATLVAKFTKFGTVVSARLSQTQTPPRSNRGAFVEMQTAAAAQAAINGLNLADYDGRLLAVYKAVTPAALAN